MISVVITCYNYGKYLSGCLESVLDQTYRDIEIIIVNDGSTDDTDEVIKKYLSNPRVRYIKQRNAGQANAKNTGIRNASGEFVAFLDADDVWEKEKLEKQLRCFDNAEVGVVYCRAKYLNEDGNFTDFEMTPYYLQPRRGKVTEWFVFDNFVQFSSSIVRKECFERCGGFDEALKMGIDWDLWLRLSPVYQFDFVDEKLLYYRMGHAGQMSKNMDERYRCADRIIKNFLEKHPGYVSRWTIRKANAFTCCGRGEYYRTRDRKKSTFYFLSAIRHNPAEIGAYKGLIKNVVTW
jgi:glycosyltransferase involved in cell wall biosynthesis